jgi:hypothetical protein
MNRTVGIVLTIVTVLCCACPGFGLCIFGGLIAAGQPVTSTLNGVESVETYPAAYGIGLLCLALIMIVIPIGVGFFAFRKKPAPVVAPVAQSFNGPIPPAS